MHLAVKWCALILVCLSVTACNQKKQKQEAYDQWNAARASAQGNLAADQYKHGNLPGARQSVDEAIKLAPRNVTYHLLSAKIYIEGNSLEAAERELDEVRRIEPKNAEADFLSGVVYQRWQKPNLALDYYTKASENSPAELSYVLARAEMLVQVNQLPQAVSLLESKLTYFEHSGAMRDLLGVLYLQQGRLKEAAESLKQATILEPEQLEFREHLARALFRTQRYREAITELTLLLKNETFAKRADMHLLLGECYLSTAALRDARGEFETAANLSPNLTAAWLGLAKASMEMGDNDRAEVSIKKAIALEPEDAQSQLALGYLRLRQGKDPEAMAALEKASALDPSDSVALCLMGLICERQGKKDEALQYYGKALQVKPDDELAKSLLSRSK